MDPIGSLLGWFIPSFPTKHESDKLLLVPMTKMYRIEPRWNLPCEGVLPSSFAGATSGGSIRLDPVETKSLRECGVPGAKVVGMQMVSV